jgi:hypothetical protein
MKLRHAAVLALVGWYLMIPPFLKKDQWGHLHADPNAPLSSWEYYHEGHNLTYDRAHALEFRTLDECEHKRREIYDGWFGVNGQRGLKDILRWDSNAIGARTEVVSDEKCVASDDPRLKSK